MLREMMFKASIVALLSFLLVVAHGLVLGGAFTDKVIVQRLTDMMWIAHSSTYEDA